MPVDNDVYNRYANSLITCLILVSLLAALTLRPASALSSNWRPYLYVSSQDTDSILRYDTMTGTLVDIFVPANRGGLDGPQGLTFGPDRNLYVVSHFSDQVLRYDGATGTFIDIFVDKPNRRGDASPASPTDLVFGPDGNLYVVYATSSCDTGTICGQGSVQRYDRTTGAFIDSFVPSVGAVGDRSFPPSGLVFGADGNLYVSTLNSVRRFNGQTGAFIDVFVAPGSGGLSFGFDLSFGPDGNLYVTDQSKGEVLRYSGATGAFIDVFVKRPVPPHPGPNVPGELDNAFALIFGPDGYLYASSISDGAIYDQVLRYDAKTGTFIDTIVPKGAGVDRATGLAFQVVPSGSRSTARLAAFVTVVQQSTPNLGVRRDSVVSNVIVVTNRGKGDASNVIITMPLDPQTVRILDAHFSRASDWVSELKSDSLVIRTGPLAHDDVITATIRLAIQPTAVEGAAVGQRLRYRWNDDRNGGQGRSNLPVLVVGQNDLNQPFYPLAVEISKIANNEYDFESNVFAPREPVALWYNTPDGRAVTVGRRTADEEGMMRSQFTSAGLTPGYYSMVAYGIWSGLTAAAPFQVH